MPPRNHEQVRRSPSAGGCSYKVFPTYLMNVCPYLIEPIVSVKLGSFLEQAFYPGGERGKSVNVEASINRVVTETGAEVSIIRYALD